VDEAVGDGRGRGLVVEELAPVLEGQVGSDDGGDALVAFVEDLVEQVCSTGIEAEIAQFVNQQQLGGCPGGKSPVQVVAGLCGDQVVDEVGGQHEADSVAAQASELADGVGQMCLADPAGSHQDAVALFFDEGQRGGPQHELAVDRLGVVEVVDVEGGEREDAGAFQRGTGTGLQCGAQLLAHDLIQQRGGRGVASDGLLGRRLQHRSRMLQPEGPQHLAERQARDEILTRGCRLGLRRLIR
jgi:hypothetical protein